MSHARTLDEDALDRLFLALANRTRREMLDIVSQAPGCTVGELTEHFDMSRIGAQKHLATLEDAGLIVSEKRGRERQLWLNAVPLRWIHERWSERYREFWAGRLTQLKRAAERETR